jgi:sulfide:quinone oxidoreductase
MSSLASTDAPNSQPEPLNVLIVGGGVAALEAALALRDLGGYRIALTILAPNHEFLYRPMTVREPFSYLTAERYDLAQIAADIGAKLVADSVKWLDHEQQIMHTQSGIELPYDEVLLAVGAHLHPRYEHTLTMDDTRLDALLHGLIQDVEEGYVHSLGLVTPPGRTWPLPIYEFALMTAQRAYEMNIEISITITTPEDSPLAIFGQEASEGIKQLLDEHHIATITSARCEVHEPGTITVHPGSRRLTVDRIVALPELLGPSLQGVPADREGGFIPTDVRGKVRGIDHVYAAGDATDFPIKHGGIAAQQADIAAQAIAASAGFCPEPQPSPLLINGVLLTGGKPLYLSARLTGTHASDSRLTDEPTWSPPTKIAAKYLSPFLEGLDPRRFTARTG